MDIKKWLDRLIECIDEWPANQIGRVLDRQVEYWMQHLSQSGASYCHEGFRNFYHHLILISTVRKESTIYEKLRELCSYLKSLSQPH